MSLTFPDLPKFHATWAPVFWEPIMLSGEKLTAVIAVAGTDGKILVEPILRADVLKILYPQKHKHAIDLLNWITESYREHLTKGGDLADWLSPASGFYAGSPREIFSKDIQTVIQQAIPLCSSLSFIDFQSKSGTTDAIEMSNERWRSGIREEVIKRLPRLQQSFNRQFKVVEGARQTTIDFVGHKTASNFSRLVTNQLSRCVRDAKSQILDLVALREDIKLFSNGEQYQLLVWRPDQALNDVMSSHQKSLIEEAFLELEGEGDRFELKVRGHFNPASAAESICKLEVAA